MPLSGHSESAGVERRRAGWLVLLALVPFLLATAHHWRSGFEIGSGDWAQYLLHAEALADGREYVDTGYLYSTLHPVTGPRAYPPGVALTAVPTIALFGSAMVPMRILSGLFGKKYDIKKEDYS